MTSFKDWAVLQKLKADFMRDIKFVYVFGKTGGEVIFATKDDVLYSYGLNVDGCLGLGHKNEIQEPTKVDELCYKHVFHLAYSYVNDGYNYALALTKNNEVYSWGANRCGQLGNGTLNAHYRPYLIKELTGKCIVDVCVSYHCLAVTKSGELYAWGYNEDGRVGCGNYLTAQMTPTRVTALSRERVVAIACGNHSLALTDAGVVYSWGNNYYGNLGTGNNSHRNSPVRVDLPSDVFINKICCGRQHSLLLAADGDVYALGANNYGQIGDGTKCNRNVPTKVLTPVKFTDISATIISNISVGVSVNKFCLVWGETAHETISAPKETALKSVYSVYAYYFKHKITLKPVYFKVKTPKPVMFKRIGQSFNDPQYSDLTFRVEGKAIHVQRLYLKSCCRHFNAMFSEQNWIESESHTIEIVQYSYAVYYAFLKYLYTNTVDVKLSETVELLDLANAYLEEELKQKCAEIMKCGIGVENVCAMFSAAVRFNCVELEEDCFEFALNRMHVVCKTDAFEQMDYVGMKRLFKRMALSGRF